jgi:hypothetical protein
VPANSTALKPTATQVAGPSIVINNGGGSDGTAVLVAIVAAVPGTVTSITGLVIVRRNRGASPPAPQPVPPAAGP